MLDRIYSYRGTAILPAQTGPVNDVLYSAAGNQADEAYYKNGIIGYDFETGADKRLADGTSIPVGLPAPVQRGADRRQRRTSPTRATTRAMEFANGNYALLKSALDYANDTTPPTSARRPAPRCPTSPSACSFTTNEASTIHYTTDGSTPTDGLARSGSPAGRASCPIRSSSTANTTLKWFAIDFKGNRSAVQSKAYVVDMVKPTVTFTSPAADGAVFTQGRPVPLTVHLRRRELRRGQLRRRRRSTNLDTSTPGTFTYSVTARGQGRQRDRGDAQLHGHPGHQRRRRHRRQPSRRTLSLTLGTAGVVRHFTPGVTRDYDCVDHRDRDLVGRRRAAQRRPTRARATSGT